MNKAGTQLRTLFIVLSVLSIVSSSLGGYLYYSSLARSSEERAHEEAEERLKKLGNKIDSYLAWSLLSVKSLAGLKELEHALVNKDDAALAQTNDILDRFCDDLGVSVCYLMDRDGNTIASSNRESQDTFVGENYGFRPYFTQAMKGVPSVYMTQGVTSKIRGIYYSHPVYARGTRIPLGVAVIKAPIESIEKDIAGVHDGVVLLTDPHGVVFISGRADWLYHVLWEVSPEERAKIEKTRQFGAGPWNWTGVKPLKEENAVDSQGSEYRVHQYDLSTYPGWHLVYLHSHNEVMKKILTPLQKSVGISILSLCISFGLIVFSLFMRANTEINRRKEAQKEREYLIVKLQSTLDEIKTLRGILPICASCKKIRDDKGYWNQIESYIKEHSDAEFTHGICPECSDKLYGEEDWYVKMKKEES